MLTVAVSEYTVFSYCSKLTVGVYSHSWHNCLREQHIFSALWLSTVSICAHYTILTLLIPLFMRACRIFSYRFRTFCFVLCSYIFLKFLFHFYYLFFLLGSATDIWSRAGCNLFDCVFFSLLTFKSMHIYFIYLFFLGNILNTSF
jgi:hypothetical protein